MMLPISDDMIPSGFRTYTCGELIRRLGLQAKKENDTTHRVTTTMIASIGGYIRRFAFLIRNRP